MSPDDEISEPSAAHRTEPSPDPSNEAASNAAASNAAPTRPVAEASSGDDEPSRQLRPTVMAIAITGAIFTVASACFFNGRAAAGTGVGALLATLNFVLFIRLVGAFLGNKGNTAAWTVLGLVKLLGLFVVVYVILKRGDLPPLSLAIGYASLPIGISLGTLVKGRGAAQQG